MLPQKKRDSLDARIERAALKKVHQKGWTDDDSKKGLALMREALLQGNSIEAMIYVLFDESVLFSVRGLEDYDFDAKIPSLEFVDNAVKARSLSERCALLALMCELLVESMSNSDVHVVQRRMARNFLCNRILYEFPEGSEAYALADMLDDSFKNLMEDNGYYSEPRAMLLVSKVLERLAAAL